MKRYLVFGYDHYYPGGGRNDYLGDFDTLTERDAAIKEQDLRWDQIDTLDTNTGRWV